MQGEAVRVSPARLCHLTRAGGMAAAPPPLAHTRICGAAMGLLPVAVGGTLSHAWSPSPWLLLFQPAGFSLAFLTAALVLNWNQTLPYSLFCRSPNTCLPLAAPSLPPED